MDAATIQPADTPRGYWRVFCEIISRAYDQSSEGHLSPARLQSHPITLKLVGADPNLTTYAICTSPPRTKLFTKYRETLKSFMFLRFAGLMTEW